MAIRYFNDDTTYRLPHKRLTSRWLVSCAGEEGCHIGEISYVFCSSERLLEINRQFLGHDYFTDIITFDYCSGNVLSGDLFISVDSVKENSVEYGTEFEDELNRVIVHGILHLIGYDDHTDEDVKVMREKENYYLDLRKHI